MTTRPGPLRCAATLCIPLLLAGCAERAYVYRPAEQATASIRGTTAARYAIPPESPAGDVRVASFGVMDIEQQDEGGEIAALHVRLVVSNDSGARPWLVDTRHVRAELRGAGDAGVPLVSTEADGLPIVEIPPGRQRTIDLFYPLPAGMEDDDVPAFDLVWRVQTDTRLVAERTPFERIALDRSPPAYGVVVRGGWYGPHWWYDPWYYPPGVVVRPSIIVAPRPIPPRVIVRPHYRVR